MRRLRDVIETDPAGPEDGVSPEFAMVSRHSNLETSTARLGDAALTDGVGESRATLFRSWETPCSSSICMVSVPMRG